MIQLILPVDPLTTVTQLFGENPKVYKRWGYSGHNGMDFAVPTGTPILAAADGTVGKIAFEAGGYGNYIMLNHGDFQTYYAHLKEAAVVVGAQVRAGDVIAYSDNTGFSIGSHLHFALKIPGQANPGYKYYHDPIPYFMAVGDEPEPEPEPAEEWNILRVISPIGLRVRMSPSTDAMVLGVLPFGTEITPRKIGNVWVEIAVYVHRDYVE